MHASSQPIDLHPPPLRTHSGLRAKEEAIKKPWKGHYGKPQKAT